MHWDQIGIEHGEDDAAVERPVRDPLVVAVTVALVGAAALFAVRFLFGGKR
jgi:hypothetical protein